MDSPLFQKFAGVEPAQRLLEAVRFNCSLDDVYLVAVMDDDVGLGPHVSGEAESLELKYAVDCDLLHPQHAQRRLSDAHGEQAHAFV